MKKIIMFILSLLFVSIITGCASSGESLKPNSGAELYEKIYLGPDCASDKGKHFVVNKDIYTYKVFKGRDKYKDRTWIVINYKPKEGKLDDNDIVKFGCKSGSVNYTEEILEHLDVQMRAIVKNNNTKQADKIAMIYIDQKYCINPGTIIANRDYYKYRNYPDPDNYENILFSYFYFDDRIEKKFRIAVFTCSKKHKGIVRDYLDVQTETIRGGGLRFNPRK